MTTTRMVPEFSVVKDSEDIRVLQDKMQSNQYDLDQHLERTPIFYNKPDSIVIYKRAIESLIWKGPSQPDHIREILDLNTLENDQNGNPEQHMFFLDELAKQQSRGARGLSEFLREWLKVETEPSLEKQKKLINFFNFHQLTLITHKIVEQSNYAEDRCTEWDQTKARMEKQTAADKYDLDLRTELLLKSGTILFNRDAIKNISKNLPYINEKSIKLKTSENELVKEFIFTTENIIAEVGLLPEGYNEESDTEHSVINHEGFINFDNAYIAIPAITWTISFHDNQIRGKAGVPKPHVNQPVSNLKFNPFHPCVTPSRFTGFSDRMVPHPHFTDSRSPCFGDWEGPIHEAVRERDLHSIMGLITTYQQNIDRLDPAGRTWLNLFWDTASIIENINTPLLNFQLPAWSLRYLETNIADFTHSLETFAASDKDWVKNEFTPPAALELDKVTRFIKIMPDLTPRFLLIYYNIDDMNTRSDHSALHDYIHHLDDSVAYFRKNYKVLYLPKGSIGTNIPFDKTTY
tara:strand:+ start:250 stop:1806 length:1557 start_codon:yes stop_codon:yes gene_type:complete